MRRVVLVTLLAVVAFMSGPSATAARPPCKTRFTVALNATQELAEELYEPPPERGPDKRGFILANYVRGKLKGCPRTDAHEMATAATIAGRLERIPDDNAERLRKGRDPIPVDPRFESSMSDASDAYDDYAVAIIERVDDFLSSIERLGNNTDKGEQYVTEARQRLERARGEPLLSARIRGFRNAIFRARRAKQATRVTQVPKKCKGRRLKGGEYCDATLSGEVVLFNIGEAKIKRNSLGETTGVTLYFRYCNGHGLDQRTLLFTASPPFLGVHDQTSVGGGAEYFLKGDGGFGSPLRAGSTVTITGVDLDSGVVQGTFRFSTGGTASNDGRFRLTSAR